MKAPIDDPNLRRRAVERSCRFWAWVGGRKALHGYIAVACLTAMAKPLGASFPGYVTGVLIALGITSGLTATEDVLKDRGDKKRNEKGGDV